MTDFDVELSALATFANAAVETAGEYTRAGQDIGHETTAAGAFGSIRRSGDLAAALSDFRTQHGERATDGGRAIGFFAEAAAESRQRYAETDLNAAMDLQQLQAQFSTGATASPFGSTSPFGLGTPGLGTPGLGTPGLTPSTSTDGGTSLHF